MDKRTRKGKWRERKVERRKGGTKQDEGKK